MGSARLQRAGFGILPKRTSTNLHSLKVRERRMHPPTRYKLALPREREHARELFAGAALQHSSRVFAI
jgi:hypothetical protein